MKRQSVIATKFEENIYDSTPGVNNYASLDASTNQYLSYNHLSDSESISEKSKKIQKKRDTYQKVSDEIRVQLLESVQNGETLKSAAKRFNVNYSSAKSVLHTYRKEGRILKKSAQERTIKKRSVVDEDDEPRLQTSKLIKKEHVKTHKTPIAPLAERTTSASTCASYSNEKTSPAVTKSANGNLAGSLKIEHYENQQVMENKALIVSPRFLMNQSAEEHMNALESFNMNRQKGMFFDNFYPKYSDFQFPEIGRDFYRNEMHSANEFEPLNVLQPRLPKNEEADVNPVFYQKGYNATYGYEEKVNKPDTYEDNLENSGNPLKGFMDTQFLFQEAFKKANFWGGNGNQGFRKSSFDLF